MQCRKLVEINIYNSVLGQVPLEGTQSCFQPTYFSAFAGAIHLVHGHDEVHVFSGFAGMIQWVHGPNHMVHAYQYLTILFSLIIISFKDVLFSQHVARCVPL